MAEAEGTLHRASVCLVGMDGPAADALRYLILHANEIQQSFEFEIVQPNRDDPLVRLLAGPKSVVVDAAFDELVEGFADRQGRYNAAREKEYGIGPGASGDYIIVSIARLSNNYYAWGVGGTGVLALGGWEKSLAPPSLVEYAFALILRLAASDAVPQIEDVRHLATRGCLFDFNPDLHTVRFKVLNSFICSTCTNSLANARGKQLADDLRRLLGKTWLGDAADARAPAAICRKLGYDLFLTRGIQPSLLQTLSAKLQGDLVSETLKLFAAVFLAYLLFRLGLSSGGKD